MDAHTHIHENTPFTNGEHTHANIQYVHALHIKGTYAGNMADLTPRELLICDTLLQPSIPGALAYR